MSPSSKVCPISRFFLKLPHSGEHLPKVIKPRIYQTFPRESLEQHRFKRSNSCIPCNVKGQTPLSRCRRGRGSVWSWSWGWRPPGRNPTPAEGEVKSLYIYLFDWFLALTGRKKIAFAACNTQVSREYLHQYYLRLRWLVLFKDWSDYARMHFGLGWVPCAKIVCKIALSYIIIIYHILYIIWIDILKFTWMASPHRAEWVTASLWRGWSRRQNQNQEKKTGDCCQHFTSENTKGLYYALFKFRSHTIIAMFSYSRWGVIIDIWLNFILTSGFT